MAPRVPLSLVPRKLLELTGKSISYRQIYLLTLDCRFPAERDNKGWSVAESDLPKVAAAAGVPLELAA